MLLLQFLPVLTIYLAKTHATPAPSPSPPPTPDFKQDNPALGPLAPTVPGTSPFTLTDPEGAALPVLSANIAPSTLTKRANTAVECPQPMASGDFAPTLVTRCERSRGARAWYCQASSGFEVRDVCAEHQICVDGFFSEVDGFARSTRWWAFCSDQDNYVKLSVELLKKLQGQHRFSRALKWYRKMTDFLPGRPTQAPDGKEHIMEAVFTGPGGVDDPVVLDGIDVVAAASRLDLSKGVDWSSVAERSCVGCSSLGIEPVPDATTMFAISPQYPASMLTGADDAVGGFMYVWQI